MKWLSAYLYYAEPWHKISVEGIKPFIEELEDTQLIQKYFFIRYWEKGPHLRLRLWVSEDNAERVKSKLTHWFEAFFKTYPSQLILSPELQEMALEQNWFSNNSIQWVEYEPEVERYGGNIALPVGEDQFQSSSNAVLSLMDGISNWSYDHALGGAIQMHLAFAYAMGMDKIETAEFYSWIFRAWLPMAIPTQTPERDREKSYQTIVDAFENQFIEQQEQLVPFISAVWLGMQDEEEFEEPWINNWISEQQEVYRKLRLLDDHNELEFPDKQSELHKQFNTPWERVKYWSLYSSFVHMTNNRLGVLNRDEGYLGYLLCKGM